MTYNDSRNISSRSLRKQLSKRSGTRQKFKADTRKKNVFKCSNFQRVFHFKLNVKRQRQAPRYANKTKIYSASNEKCKEHSSVKFYSLTRTRRDRAKSSVIHFDAREFAVKTFRFPMIFLVYATASPKHFSLSLSFVFHSRDLLRCLRNRKSWVMKVSRANKNILQRDTLSAPISACVRCGLLIMQSHDSHMARQ